MQACSSSSPSSSVRSGSGARYRPSHEHRSSAGFQARWILHRHQKIAGEKIVKQVSERRRATQLRRRNHSIRLAPFPTGSRNTLQPFAQLCSRHRIGVDANILREESRKRFEEPPFEIAVNILKRSNGQGKSGDETHRRLRVAVHESCHIVERALAKKQHVAAGSEKSIDTTKQIGNLRHRFAGQDRSRRQAKKSGGRCLGFAQLFPKLLDTRSQQSHVNLRVI